jgi:hypothetical protein
MVICACGIHPNPTKVSNFQYGQFSVKTPTPVHPFLKVGKPLQIWFLFSPVLERKKYKNGKKNSMKLVR